MDSINTRLLKQLIRVLERMDGHGTACPLQQHEDTISSEDASSPKHDLPRPILTVHAITELGDAETRQRKAERHSYYALQQQGLLVQKGMLLVTALAFGAAAYYAWIAKQQFVVMNDTLQEAHVQNVAQQRAVLAIDGPPFFLDSGKLAIRIKNNGRLAARIPEYDIMYMQRDIFGKSFGRFRQSKPNSTVSAGDAYTIAMSLPPIPPYRIDPRTKLPITGQHIWDLSINLDVRYDGGFSDKETLNSCFSYDPRTYTWGATCMSVNSVDLSGESKQNPDIAIK